MIETDASSMRGDSGSPCLLSIVAPVFNEAASVANTASLLTTAAVAAVGDHYELLFADDGSQDGTRHLLEQLAAHNHRVRIIGDRRHHGYGAMVRRGIASARGEYILLTDGDGQFACLELARLWPQRTLSDVLIGYRVGRREGWHRRAGTQALRWLNRLVFGLRVRDVDCSFKFARAEVFQSFDLRCNGFGIDTEIVLELIKRRMRYLEVPVKHDPRSGGRSTLTAVRLLASLGEFLVVACRKLRS